jgi:hypothetical protein
MINAYKILVEKPEGRSPLERPNANGSTILKWVLRK